VRISSGWVMRQPLAGDHPGKSGLGRRGLGSGRIRLGDLPWRARLFSALREQAHLITRATLPCRGCGSK